MKNNTTFGIDLAKNTIQIAELRNGKVTSNRAVSPAAFKTMVPTHKPMKLVFEARDGAHYWAHLCQQHDHQATISPTQFVAGSRQGKRQMVMMLLPARSQANTPKPNPLRSKQKFSKRCGRLSAHSRRSPNNPRAK